MKDRGIVLKWWIKKKKKSPYLLLQENPQEEHHLAKPHALSNKVSHIYIYILIDDWCGN